MAHGASGGAEARGDIAPAKMLIAKHRHLLREVRRKTMSSGLNRIRQAVPESVEPTPSFRVLREISSEPLYAGQVGIAPYLGGRPPSCNPDEKLLELVTSMFSSLAVGCEDLFLVCCRCSRPRRCFAFLSRPSRVWRHAPRSVVAPACRMSASRAGAATTPA